MAESNPTQVILTDDGIKIIKAQNTADNAASGVTNLNDPSLMSVIEKQYNISQFAGLTSQYNVIVQGARDDGIDTNAIATAYNNLNKFMAGILADPNHASDIDRITYKKYQDAYNGELSKLQNALQNNANDKFTSAANATSQAASTANIAKSAADSSYRYASSEIAAQSEVAAKAQKAADDAFNKAIAAVNTANSTASDFGKVDKNASSALANALSAQDDASSAVKQASSAAADSKDAKQIAGAVSQSYKKLTDGSTMTIAELQNGLGAKLTKNDLNGYATQDWAQNQIKFTADGINGKLSSIKNTVDGQTTSISDLKADSSSFKGQFTTVNGTLGKHTTDIGSLQTTSKSLSSNFDSLSGDNNTNKHDISQLQQTAKEFSNTLETVQTQVTDSSVGTNLIIQSDLKPGFLDRDKDGVVGSGDNFYSDNYIATNGKTVFTLSSPDYVLKGTYNHTLAMYDSDKKYLGWQNILSPTLTLSKSNVAYIRFSINAVDEGGISGHLSDWLDSHRYKLEKGSHATDYSTNPLDNATVTAVSKLSQTVDSIKTTVSEKVDNQDYQSFKDQTSRDISSAVKSKDFESYKTETSGLIGSKVDNGDFATYKEQTSGLISDRVTTKDFSSYKEETARSIGSKVESSDFNTYKEQTDQAILSKVSKLDANNANLIPYSSNFTTPLTGWTLMNWGATDRKLLVTTHAFYQNGTGTLLYLNTAQNGTAAAGSNRFPLLPNTTYTFQFKAFASSNVVGANVYLLSRAYGSTSDYDTAHGLFKNLVTSSSHIDRYTVTFTTGANDNEGYIRVDNIGSNNSASSGLFFTELKLELGGVATPYVYGGQDSMISQMSDDINLRVTKDGLVDQINIQAGKTLISSSGQLTLSGKNIYFDSTNPVIIPSANIDTALVNKKLTAADISANTFKTNNGTFTVDKNGAIKAKNMTLIGGTLTSPTINTSKINGSTINGTTFNAGEIISNPYNTSRFYPTTIMPTGLVATTGFNSMDGLRTEMSAGSFITKYRAVHSSGNQYEAYDGVFSGDELALNSGFTNGIDMGFQQSVSGNQLTGQVVLSPLNGIHLWGSTQSIHFSGLKMNGTGITFNSYGNIIADQGATWWRIVSNNDQNVANFGIDKAGSNVIEFNRDLWVNNMGLGVSHQIRSKDGHGIYFTDKNSNRVDTYHKNIYYSGSASKSLLSEKTNVKAADVNYWSNLAMSIDLATYNYDTDDYTDPLRLSGVIDDVNAIKEWTLPEAFYARDEDGSIVGIDNGVLLNAVLALSQEQAKQIDKLNANILAMEAKING